MTCICQTSIDSGKAQAQTTALLKLLKNAGINDDIHIQAMYKQNKKLDPVSVGYLQTQQENKKTIPS